MDVSATPIRLHPGAKNYLFQNFQSLRYIFSDVLGQAETDYLSIALINIHNELFFISSTPSIEQSLIEKNLWQYDNSYQTSFVAHNKPGLWSEVTPPKDALELYQYKQNVHGLICGLSIPYQHPDYSIVFSYGFKKSFSQQQLWTQQHKLIAMGKFCLRKIIDAIPLLDRQNASRPKPDLKLIINNKEAHEITT